MQQVSGLGLSLSQALMAALLLAGCVNVLPGGSPRVTLAPQLGEARTGPGDAPDGGAASGGQASTQEGGSVDRVMRGQFRMPLLQLVSNDSAGLSDVGAGIFLSDVGGGMFYRTMASIARTTQALEESGRAGANVVVESADARVLGPAVRTDDAGRFAVRLPLTASGSVLIRVTLPEGGVTYAFGAIASLPASGEASADVDLASSLVANTLAMAPDRSALIRQLDLRRLPELLGLLRTRLAPDVVPYMASGSLDVPALLGQIIEDDGEVRAVARALNPRLGLRGDSLRVSTLFTARDLVRLGIHKDDLSFAAAGPFAVDASGDILLPRQVAEASEAIEIVRLASSGATSSFATLPTGYVNPILQAFGPDGRYWAAALHVESGEVRVFKQAASGLVLDEGPLVTFPARGTRSLGGRLAVDARDNVVCTLPDASIVVVKAPGQQGRVLAGSFGVAGFADGQGDVARFRDPAGAVFGPDGAVYVTDEGNRAIRRVSRLGIVTTVAGAPDGELYRIGRGQAARFGSPESLVVLGRSVIVSDARSNRIRRVSASGMVFTVAGTGEDGVVDGPAAEAKLSRPKALRLDGEGNLYFQDRVQDPVSGDFYQVIRKISRD
ncbi:MAG: hypothetical protein VKO64_09115 [Candidatus Sericytochromatia bacterium]|nr:hypothetical protein [Candidatus Sericytochromatia bacterium]